MSGSSAIGPFLVAGFLLVTSGCRPSVTPAPTAHLIEIRGMRFVPPEARVSPGDTVIWVNRDLVPHTATARDSTWSSAPLEPEESWSWVVEGSGTKEYTCVFHPTMEGRLNINSAS